MAMTSAQRDALARTLISEAGSLGTSGMRDVASVIVNRGGDPYAVVSAPGQFAGFDAGYGKTVSTNSNVYAAASSIVEEMASGSFVPTNGATSFVGTGTRNIFSNAYGPAQSSIPAPVVASSGAVPRLWPTQPQMYGVNGDAGIGSGMNNSRGRLHAGNDYYTPVGTSLSAQGNGTVRYSSPVKGYGNYVVISYTSGPLTGMTMAYAHLSSSLVKVGQHVGVGQQFAISGASGTQWGSHPGSGTPPHVHIEATTTAAYNRTFGIGGGTIGGIGFSVRTQQGVASLISPSDLYGRNGGFNGGPPTPAQRPTIETAAGAVNTFGADPYDPTMGLGYGTPIAATPAQSLQEVLDQRAAMSASQLNWANITSTPDYGVVSKGNIDLTSRPRVLLADGSIATVRSASFEINGNEVLLPTVAPDGTLLTNQQALDRYHATGENLGIFSSIKAADAYAENLHQQQAQQYAGLGPNVISPAAKMLMQALPPGYSDSAISTWHDAASRAAAVDGVLSQYQGERKVIIDRMQPIIAPLPPVQHGGVSLEERTAISDANQKVAETQAALQSQIRQWHIDGAGADTTGTLQSALQDHRAALTELMANNSFYAMAHAGGLRSIAVSGPAGATLARYDTSYPNAIPPHPVPAAMPAPIQTDLPGLGIDKLPKGSSTLQDAVDRAAAALHVTMPMWQSTFPSRPNPPVVTPGYRYDTSYVGEVKPATIIQSQTEPPTGVVQHATPTSAPLYLPLDPRLASTPAPGPMPPRETAITPEQALAATQNMDAVVGIPYTGKPWVPDAVIGPVEQRRYFTAPLPAGQAASKAIENMVSGSNVDMSQLTAEEKAKVVAAIPHLLSMPSTTNDQKLDIVRYMQSAGIYEPLLKAVPTEKSNGAAWLFAQSKGVDIGPIMPKDISTWGIKGISTGGDALLAYQDQTRLANMGGPVLPLPTSRPTYGPPLNDQLNGVWWDQHALMGDLAVATAGSDMIHTQPLMMTPGRPDNVGIYIPDSQRVNAIPVPAPSYHASSSPSYSTTSQGGGFATSVGIPPDLSAHSGDHGVVDIPAQTNLLPKWSLPALPSYSHVTSPLSESIRFVASSGVSPAVKVPEITAQQYITRMIPSTQPLPAGEQGVTWDPVKMQYVLDGPAIAANPWEGLALGNMAHPYQTPIMRSVQTTNPLYRQQLAAQKAAIAANANRPTVAIYGHGQTYGGGAPSVAPPATFSGSATGQAYTVGQVYSNGSGSYTANANGTFTNNNTGNVAGYTHTTPSSSSPGSTTNTSGTEVYNSHVQGGMSTNNYDTGRFQAADGSWY